MNHIERRVFLYFEPDFTRLCEYGFKKTDGGFTYEAEILDGSMRVSVFIRPDGTVETGVRDGDTDDLYTLHTVEDACGEFVGKVRAQYESVLEGICRNCFRKKIFKDGQVDEILAFARREWNTEAEFLWADTPDCCVLRRADTGKWYGVIIAVKAEKLGLNGGDFKHGDGKAVLLVLRAAPEEVEAAVDGARYLPAYHLNKKHWMSIPLNGALPAEEIFSRLKMSRLLAVK